MFNKITKSKMLSIVYLSIIMVVNRSISSPIPGGEEEWQFLDLPKDVSLASSSIKDGDSAANGRMLGEFSPPNPSYFGSPQPKYIPKKVEAKVEYKESLKDAIQREKAGLRSYPQHYNSDFVDMEGKITYSDW